MRDSEIADLEEKNKQLTQECQVLTVRMLEEKGKMIEMMNEANNIFDGAQRAKSMMQPEGDYMDKEFEVKRHTIASKDQWDDLSDLLKPEYLNQGDMSKPIDNLPVDVKIRMVAHTDACTTMEFNPTGDMIATGGADKEVAIWNVKDMSRRGKFSYKAAVSCMAFSHDNNYLTVCSKDQRCSYMNLRTMKTQTQFGAHQDSITSTKFIFSAKQVMTASLDQTIKCWDINSFNASRVINTFS